MKKALPVFTFFAIVVVVALVAGRPPSIEPEQYSTTLPENLDQYLSQAESAFDDIVPGANKVIFWADSVHEKTPLSVVYVHGFSATRQETAPLSDSLAKRWGANLFYTRLSGHGRSGDAMGEATVDDWLEDASEALDIGRRIGERVVLIGTSTGGTLVTWLATQPETQDLAGMILISPNFWPRAENVELLLWPYGALIGKAVQGKYVEWEPANEGHAMYWTNRYPVTAAVELMRLVKFVDELPLQTVSVPTLVVYSPDDQVVDPEYITRKFEEIGSPKKQIIPIDSVQAENNHVLAGAILSPNNTAQVVEYIDSFMHNP